MLDKTKSLLEKIQNYEDIPDRVKCIQDYYKGEDCYLLAAGPSLNKYDVDYIKDKIGDKLVIALKQSISNFYDITDFHVLNFTNFEPYDYTDSKDTITIWEVFEQYHPQMIQLFHLLNIKTSMLYYRCLIYTKRIY